mmetsp:Transcript_7529/g.31157  ORF Transcript_7529/g.31157 Transcript_7529/m.31157 type:complete len:282 (-) Transcript_7529:764-1609(-)
MRSASACASATTTPSFFGLAGYAFFVVLFSAVGVVDDFVSWKPIMTGACGMSSRFATATASAPRTHVAPRGTIASSPSTTSTSPYLSTRSQINLKTTTEAYETLRHRSYALTGMVPSAPTAGTAHGSVWRSAYKCGRTAVSPSRTHRPRRFHWRSPRSCSTSARRNTFSPRKKPTCCASESKCSSFRRAERSAYVECATNPPRVVGNDPVPKLPASTTTAGVVVACWLLLLSAGSATAANQCASRLGSSFRRFAGTSSSVVPDTTWTSAVESGASPVAATT